MMEPEICLCGNPYGSEGELQQLKRIRSKVYRHFFLCLDLFGLRHYGLLLIVILVVRLTTDDRLGGYGLQSLEAGEIDGCSLGIGTGIAELDKEAARLGIEDDRLALQIRGIVDGNAIAIVVVAR